MRVESMRMSRGSSKSSLKRKSIRANVDEKSREVLDRKANILVLGTSGAGKSTLINTVIGKEVAPTGNGKHITEKMCSYESEDLNFRLIDSRGFEYNMRNTNKSVKDMKEWLHDGLKTEGENQRIHMLWFCVDATSKRFTRQMLQTVETVKKEWADVPIIVVLTKSFFSEEDEENMQMIRESFMKHAKHTGMPIAIIPVLAIPPKGYEIPVRGIDELIATTENNLEQAFRDAEEAVNKFTLKWKKYQSQMITVGATAAAAIVGAIPSIPIPDALILTPLETTMISSIAGVYELNKDEDRIQRIIQRIIEAGTISMIAKSAIQQLKLIQGPAQLPVDALNAFVAGAIVLGIGEASALIMEKVYLGEIDEEKLDWVDDIVQGSMNVTIQKIAAIVKENDGKIDLGKIIAVFFEKK